MRNIFITVLLFIGKMFGSAISFTEMILYEYLPHFEVTILSCHEELRFKHGLCPIPSTFSNLSSSFRNPSSPTFSSTQIIHYFVALY
jgi:hypothetical protein